MVTTDTSVMPDEQIRHPFGSSSYILPSQWISPYTILSRICCFIAKQEYIVLSLRRSRTRSQWLHILHATRLSDDQSAVRLTSRLRYSKVSRIFRFLSLASLVSSPARAVIVSCGAPVSQSAKSFRVGHHSQGLSVLAGWVPGEVYIGVLEDLSHFRSLILLLSGHVEVVPVLASMTTIDSRACGGRFAYHSLPTIVYGRARKYMTWKTTLFNDQMRRRVDKAGLACKLLI